MIHIICCLSFTFQYTIVHSIGVQIHCYLWQGNIYHWV